MTLPIQAGDMGTDRRFERLPSENPTGFSGISALMKDDTPVSRKKKGETLNVSCIQRFLLGLSYTELDVIVKCPKSELGARVLNGILILVTMTAALLSMSYAAWISFHRWSIAIAIGVVWAVFVMALDRQLLTHTGDLGDGSGGQGFFEARLLPFMIRLPVGLLIAFAVSVPLEMLFFRDDIDRQLTGSVAVSVDLATTRLRERRNLDRERLEERRKELEVALHNAITARDSMLEKLGREERSPIWITNWSVDAKGERVTRRTRVESVKLQQLKAQYPDAALEVRKLTKERDDVVAAINHWFEASNEGTSPQLSLAATKPIERFFERYDALSSVLDNNAHGVALHWLVRAILITVELGPAFMKLVQSARYYHQLLIAKYDGIVN